MSTYADLAELPLEIEGYTLERHERDVSSGFRRVSTVVRLHGGGHEGAGEDVTYDADLQTAFQQRDATRLPFAGRHTLDSFSALVEGLDLFDGGAVEQFVPYRRWGVESAALDLALRQAGTSLAAALGREPRPVRFVVSLRLGEPPSAEVVLRRLDLDPTLQFKLDATSSWDDALCATLAATGAVESIDLKGAYHGTVVDQKPDPELYRRVAEAFPAAWIEDPALVDGTREALEPYRDRITWDAPIHSVADIEGLPFPPRTINVKPSRFGSLRALFEAYDHCEARGIGAYGGGQFELSVGRGQIQYLAALFHADAPNDIAPGGYNEAEPRADLPRSPLAPALDAVGFRWLG